MSVEMVRNALEYYDKNSEDFDKFLDKVHYIYFEKYNDEMTRDKVLFYGEDKTLIHKARYESIGSYTPDNELWIWAWSIPYHKKNKTYTIAKILNYGIQLPPTDLFLKSELTTSRFRITNNVQLEMHAAIASYLAKVPFVIPYIVPSHDKNIDKIQKGNIAYLDDPEYFRFKRLKETDDLTKLPKGTTLEFLYILDLPL